MTKIGLIRHGITDWNIARRAQGQTDIPLNVTGRQQAHALAERLMNEPWERIYASDLSRAKETAEIIGDALGLSVHTDPRLREMSCGEIEGTTLEERIAKWGKAWDTLPLGVEEDEAIAERGMAAISEIARSADVGQILIVSHGALLGRALKKMIPHEDTSAHLDNTSVTLLKHNDSQWDCLLYNCTKHLDSLAPA